MAKLDIDFTLIDESVVRNGFRVLMSGAELDEFIANPVMLFMHNRSQAAFEPATNDIMLPIGKWYDIRVEDGKLLAKPDFDENDPFAKKIESKVEGGYLSGASIWIDPIACSDDENLMLPGQRGATVTKWGILESSVVDIPNCRNSLAIRNSVGKRITLSGTGTDDAEVLGFLNTLIKNSDKKPFMEKKLLCAKLGLDENASDSIVSEKLSAIVAAGTANTMLTTENKRLTDALALHKKESDEKKVTDLVDAGIAEHKLVAGDRDKYIKLATADFATTEDLIKGMKAYKSIESQLTAGAHTETQKLELQELLKLSGHQLYMTGKLETLKELSLEHFKLKYKDALGIEYKGV